MLLLPRKWEKILVWEGFTQPSERKNSIKSSKNYCLSTKFSNFSQAWKGFAPEPLVLLFDAWFYIKIEFSAVKAIICSNIQIYGENRIEIVALYWWIFAVHFEAGKPLSRKNLGYATANTAPILRHCSTLYTNWIYPLFIFSSRIG